jgi:hypothetical protein
MATATVPVTRDRLTTAVVALLALQVVHGATPAKTSSEGYAGLIAGVFALAATIAALVGLRRKRPWARPLAGLTGGTVAIGFVLYHVLPFHTPLTNPYVGEVGVGPWIPVVAVVLAGVACAYYALAQSEA